MIVEVVGAIKDPVAVHIGVLVSGVTVVVVIFAGGMVRVAAAAVGSPLVGGDGQRSNEDQKTGKRQGGEFLTHGKTSFFVRLLGGEEMTAFIIILIAAVIMIPLYWALFEKEMAMSWTVYALIILAIDALVLLR